MAKGAWSLLVLSAMLVWLGVITMPAWSFYFFGPHEAGMFMDAFFLSTVNVYGKLGNAFIWFIVPPIFILAGMFMLRRT